MSLRYPAQFPGTPIPAMRAKPAGSSPMSAPTSFTTGPFAGWTIRGELIELQKADMGRKYGQKDRRPLDPPPVLQLRFYRVFNNGTAQQWEHEIDTYTYAGLKQQRRDAIGVGWPSSNTRTVAMFSDFVDSSVSHAKAQVAVSDDDQNVEGASTYTTLLVGTRAVSASCVYHEGKKILAFVFSDLAVRAEGSFFMRYRVFDIMSAVTGGTQHPALAEAFGGTFQVYSTKNFPGLQASTDLTKARTGKDPSGTTGARPEGCEHDRVGTVRDKYELSTGGLDGVHLRALGFLINAYDGVGADSYPRLRQPAVALKLARFSDLIHAFGSVWIASMISVRRRLNKSVTAFKYSEALRELLIRPGEEGRPLGIHHWALPGRRKMSADRAANQAHVPYAIARLTRGETQYLRPTVKSPGEDLLLWYRALALPAVIRIHQLTEVSSDSEKLHITLRDTGAWDLPFEKAGNLMYASHQACSYNIVRMQFRPTVSVSERRVP
ncbi:predicted protein [Postia placenta Mad-698-R]|nr:predicted protein [Postia placenta Mad-698-R]